MSEALMTVAMVFMGLFLGFVIGVSVGDGAGRVSACKSVNAEWSKDKCVRVIREDVK